jgi:hypothetical protein
LKSVIHVGNITTGSHVDRQSIKAVMAGRVPVYKLSAIVSDKALIGPLAAARVTGFDPVGEIG